MLIRQLLKLFVLLATHLLVRHILNGLHFLLLDLLFWFRCWRRMSRIVAGDSRRWPNYTNRNADDDEHDGVVRLFFHYLGVFVSWPLFVSEWTFRNLIYIKPDWLVFLLFRLVFLVWLLAIVINDLFLYQDSLHLLTLLISDSLLAQLIYSLFIGFLNSLHIEFDILELFVNGQFLFRHKSPTNVTVTPRPNIILLLTFACWWCNMSIIFVIKLFCSLSFSSVFFLYLIIHFAYWITCFVVAATAIYNLLIVICM